MHRLPDQTNGNPGIFTSSRSFATILCNRNSVIGMVAEHVGFLSHWRTFKGG